MDLGITGKVALVTGGSAGIGKATAYAFAREGVRVAICGRTLSTLEETARAIREETAGDVLPVQADVMVKADLEHFVEAAVDHFGTIDIIVNNADVISHEGSFFDLSDEDWLEKFNIKLLAPIRLIRLAAPFMQRSGWGRIINMGGTSARVMRDAGWGKGATQAGLINLTKKLSDLLGRDGITVNLVEPGAIWTDGKTKAGRSRAEIRRADVERAAEREGISYDEMNKRLLGELVIGRRIEPEDVADTILFLCSKRSGAITGEVVLIDGGETRAVRF